MPEDFDLDALLEQDGIDRAQLRAALEMLAPVDLAECLEDVDPVGRARTLEVLDADYAARVYGLMPDAARQDAAAHLADAPLAAIAAHLQPDVLTDLTQSMPEDRRERLLAALNPKQRQDVVTLRRYAPHTAGGLMNTNFVAVPETFTTAQTLKTIQGAVTAETVEYIYVVDDAGTLRGVCSIRAILRHPAEATLATIMKRGVATVKPDLDQEEVARLATDRTLLAVPVVDDAGRLLGVVSADDIIDVIHKEASEDIHKLVGVGSIDPVHDSVARRVRLRIPWAGLVVGIELGTALVISGFIKTIEQVVILSMFMPVTMALGGGVGVQSSTIVVRGLALGQVTAARAMRVIFAELRTGLAIGVICGLVTGAIAYGFHPARDEAARMGLIILLSMTSSVFVAATWGSIVPLLLNRWKMDPAIASGPLITSTNDVISVTVYLSIATALLAR